MKVPDVLEHAHTPIGTIYLERERVPATGEWVYRIQIEGQLLMSSRNPVSERQLSTTALSLHKGTAPLRVLVGGLGLGYTAEAALVSDRVVSVRVVEKMDFVIDWMKRGLFPLSQELAAEERVELVQGDVYEDLLGPALEQYDLVLIDVDHAPSHPLSPASAPFYTIEGQKQVARHLRPGGILAVWSAVDNDAFADVLAEVYPKSKREDVHWPNDDGGDPFHNVLFFAGMG